MENIRYVQVRAGNLRNFRFITEPLGKPDPGKVRVKVKATGLNFADIFACLGLYSATPKGSFTPGLEFSGVIVETGSNVTSLRAGDAVMGVTRFGALSSYIDISPEYLYTLPEDWSFEEGASFLVNVLTAWYGLVETGRLHSGKLVLVQSAAGGVGLYALQILNFFQSPFCAAVGSAQKKEFLLTYGIPENHIIIRSKNPEEFYKDLKLFLENMNREGFDIIFDSVAGRYFSKQLQLLNRTGIYVLFGASDFMSFSDKPRYLSLLLRYLRFPGIHPLHLVSQNRSIAGFNLIWLYDKTDFFRNILDTISSYPWKKPVISKVYPFAFTYEAMKFLQSGNSTGKVVIRMEDIKN